MATGTWFPLAFGYLIPVGFFLLALGGMEPEQARRASVQGLVALALAALGYLAVGFAFHLGGAAVISDAPGLAGLNRLIGYRVESGLYWGVIGLNGFFLAGDAGTPQALALFAAYLPMATTAALLPVLSLAGRARGWQTALLGLVTVAVLFPLVACWTWGGGWLAALGRTVQNGHGLVDYAGSGVVYLLGGAIALGGHVALGRKPPRTDWTEPLLAEETPPAPLPLQAALGGMLILVGWLGWAGGGLFHAAGAQLELGRVVVNGLLATATATLACAVYSWLTLGRGDALMIARGAVAGLVAISAAAPFVPLWVALLAGLAAGLVLPLGVYFIEHSLRLADSAAIVATTVIGGVVGLFAPALFADGRWGQGWNGVGLTEYRTVAGQGVTGLVAASGFLADGTGQTIAQAAGVGVILLLGFVSAWLIVGAVRDRR